MSADCEKCGCDLDPNLKCAVCMLEKKLAIAVEALKHWCEYEPPEAYDLDQHPAQIALKKIGEVK
jgi:hypothetical protein